MMDGGGTGRIVSDRTAVVAPPEPVASPLSSHTARPAAGHTVLRRRPVVRRRHRPGKAAMFRLTQRGEGSAMRTPVTVLAESSTSSKSGLD
jgi:hypothetical protein